MAADNTTFDYKPDAGRPSGKASPSVSWTAYEFIEHQRGASWYALLTLLTVIVATAIYVFTKDTFATIIIVVLGIIVASVAHHRPDNITYQLDERGLQAGTKNYTYNQFRSFAVIREGQLNSLVMVPLKRFVPPVSVYFETEDEDKILAIVGEHLPMEQRTIDPIDKLSRRLRF